MGVSDIFGKVRDWLNMSPYLDDDEPNLGNGGHSGYIPKPSQETKGSGLFGRLRGKDKTRVPRKPQGQSAPQGGQPGYAQGQGYAQGGQPGYAQGGQPVQPAQAWQTPGGRPANGFGQASGPQRPQGQGNLVYMPGVMRDENGNGYRQLQRVMNIASLPSCFRAIEFMRNRESLIINVEMLPDEITRNRVIDLLYGAAFTMGCQMHKIATRALYMITPPDVKVTSFPEMQAISDEDMAARGYPQNGQGWHAPMAAGGRG